MKIKTNHDPKPIPSRAFDWTAVDDDTYDGTEGSPIGYGATEQAAKDDLIRQHIEDGIERDCKRAIEQGKVWNNMLDKLFGAKS